MINTRNYLYFFLSPLARAESLKILPFAGETFINKVCCPIGTLNLLSAQKYKKID